MKKCKCYLAASCPEMKTDGMHSVGGAETGLSYSIQAPLILNFRFLFTFAFYHFKNKPLDKDKNTPCMKGREKNGQHI